MGDQENVFMNYCKKDIQQISALKYNESRQLMSKFGETQRILLTKCGSI